jgi:hypothetical protein
MILAHFYQERQDKTRVDNNTDSSEQKKECSTGVYLTSHRCMRSPLIAFSEDAMRTFLPCAMLSGTILST